jgi:hypothetical protein
MKTTIQRFILVLLMAGMGASCTTAYDAYGNPRPVVDPGTALLGAAAAGLVGYGIGRNNSHDHYNDHRHYARYSGHHHGHSRYYY